jgi:hypothetical protein
MFRQLTDSSVLSSDWNKPGWRLLNTGQSPLVSNKAEHASCNRLREKSPSVCC